MPSEWSYLHVTNTVHLMAFLFQPPYSSLQNIIKSKTNNNIDGTDGKNLCIIKQYKLSELKNCDKAIDTKAMECVDFSQESSKDNLSQPCERNQLRETSVDDENESKDLFDFAHCHSAGFHLLNEKLYNNNLPYSPSQSSSIYSSMYNPVSSFGLHSPDLLEEKNCYKFDIAVDSLFDIDPDIIDLREIPPPSTPDDTLSDLTSNILNVPPSEFDDSHSIQNFEAFLKNATIKPPIKVVTPVVELTSEEILSFIIPPPPPILAKFPVEQFNDELKSKNELFNNDKSVKVLKPFPLPKPCVESRQYKCVDTKNNVKSKVLLFSAIRSETKMENKGNEMYNIKELPPKYQNRCKAAPKRPPKNVEPVVPRSQRLDEIPFFQPICPNIPAKPTNFFKSQFESLQENNRLNVNPNSSAVRINNENKSALSSSPQFFREHKKHGKTEYDRHKEEALFSPQLPNVSLGKTVVALNELLHKLDQIEMQIAQGKSQYASGEAEAKFRNDRSELADVSLKLVTCSKLLVIAMSDDKMSNYIPDHLTACLSSLRKITDISEDMARTAPLKSRNIILKIHDVASSFKEMIQLEKVSLGAIALHANCLANVLANLLQYLRVFDIDENCGPHLNQIATNFSLESS